MNPKMGFRNNPFLGSAMFRIAQNRASEQLLLWFLCARNGKETLWLTPKLVEAEPTRSITVLRIQVIPLSAEPPHKVFVYRSCSRHEIVHYCVHCLLKRLDAASA